MKRVQYLVRINKETRSDWGASVPDLRGCVATGKTIDSAVRRIGQAIEMHLRAAGDAGLTRRLLHLIEETTKRFVTLTSLRRRNRRRLARRGNP